MQLNGNSGYAAAAGQSVTGSDKPPSRSLATWLLAVIIWHDGHR